MADASPALVTIEGRDKTFGVGPTAIGAGGVGWMDASPISGTARFPNSAMREAPALKVPPDYRIVFTLTCSEAAIKLIDRVWTKLKR